MTIWPRCSSWPSASGLNGKLDVGRRVQPDPAPVACGEGAVAGDVVGVQVGVDDVGDAVVALGGQVQVRLDVELRVDDGGFAALARSQKYEAQPVSSCRNCLKYIKS